MAKLYDDEFDVDKLMARLDAAMNMATLLEEEIRIVRNDLNAVAAPISLSFEAVMAHLSIDMQYMALELKKLKEGKT